MRRQTIQKGAAHDGTIFGSMFAHHTQTQAACINMGVCWSRASHAQNSCAGLILEVATKFPSPPPNLQMSLYRWEAASGFENMAPQSNIRTLWVHVTLSASSSASSLPSPPSLHPSFSWYGSPSWQLGRGRSLTQKRKKKKNERQRVQGPGPPDRSPSWSQPPNMLSWPALGTAKWFCSCPFVPLP